jgi:hypothetical protein
MGTGDGVQLLSVDPEAMQVHVVPAEGDLEDIVQAGEGGVGADGQAAPNQGADPQQYDPQLVDRPGSSGTGSAMAPSWPGGASGATVNRLSTGPATPTGPPFRALASHGVSHSPSLSWRLDPRAWLFRSVPLQPLTTDLGDDHTPSQLSL